MIEATHTPGPWEIEGPASYRAGEVAIGTVANDNDSWSELATVVVRVDGLPSPEGEANARLIAAAPDLLAACRLALVQFSSLAESGIPVMHQIKELSTAIRKATGEQA